MKDQERAGLQRDLSDALDAIRQGKSVLSLDGLADHLVELGPLYRFHGVLLRGALQRKDHGAIIAELIQVLDKLERGVS